MRKKPEPKPELQQKAYSCLGCGNPLPIGQLVICGSPACDAKLRDIKARTLAIVTDDIAHQSH